MGVLSFLRVAKRPSASATPSTAPATQPHGPARKSADANLERLEQEFGHAVAPAASALREATEQVLSDGTANAAESIAS